MIEVKLSFASAAEAASALALMAGVIAPADRPDAGARPALATPAAPPSPTAAAVFGGAVVPAAPPAPSTAGAAAPSTAPAAPTATSLPPPPVATPPAAPPVSAAAAPVAPAAPTNPAGIELDADGLPWDGRIHGKAADGGGSKNADGRWRQKRGLNDLAFKARVEAELRAALAAGAPVGTGVPPAAAAMAPPPPVPPAPPGTGVPPPAPPAPVAAVETFPTLIGRLTPHMRPDRLTDAHISQVLATVGLTGIAQLATRPDLVVAVAPQFDALLAGLPA